MKEINEIRFPHLRKLWIRHNSIESIENLSRGQFQQLTELDLSKN